MEPEELNSGTTWGGENVRWISGWYQICCSQFVSGVLNEPLRLLLQTLNFKAAFSVTGKSQLTVSDRPTVSRRRVFLRVSRPLKFIFGARPSATVCCYLHHQMSNTVLVSVCLRRWTCTHTFMVVTEAELLLLYKGSNTVKEKHSYFSTWLISVILGTVDYNTHYIKLLHVDISTEKIFHSCMKTNWYQVLHKF